MGFILRARPGVVLRLLLAVAAAGCAEPETVLPLGPLLSQGGFVPRQGVAALGAVERGRGQPAFWLPQPALPVDGWGRALRGWRPVGARSTLDLWSWHADATDLIFELRRRRSSAALRVSAWVNGSPVGSTALGSGRTRARHPLPPGVLRAVNRVELRFEPPVGQPELGAGELALTRIGLGSRGAPRGGRPESERRASVEAEDSRITFSTSGVYVLPLAIPAGALELGYEARGAGGGAGGSELRLWAVDAEGRRHDLAPIAGEPGAGPGGWAAGAANVERLRGSEVFLGIEAELAEAGGQLAIRGLQLRLARAPRRSPPAATRTAPAPPPDVVLIVLDAARADRFDGRYHRELTPNLDRIAPESVAFEHAYSGCPNTICSIPDLITGRSFIDLGGVFDGVELSDEVVTLAESLGGAGYRAVGLSANPNNSAARNEDQGFDDWRELWGRRAHRDALAMSELAAGIIAAQPPGQPLFLQLHYLPPHQPYAPAPEFDLYTDPDYRGPVGPGVPVESSESGRAQLAPADLEQLIALYDGNVRFADAAVGRVIEALRSAGRWPNTLLVVTSDHGEAFFEHGHHGHNSTLFDEMLHVPLIVRLPGGQVPDGIETDRLATLADVVPTVLGHLGLEPAPEVDGIDLLDRRPDRRRHRVLYHRTNHRRPLLAARSRAWKLIVRPALGERMLFDLSADPGERLNLAAERPWMYTGLALLLRRRLEAAAGRALESIPVELGADERAVLESLGYVD